MLIENPTHGARFRALTATSPSHGEPIDLEQIRKWTVAGLNAGEHAQVERRLLALLDTPVQPLVRAALLRLLATTLWRQRRLAAAVALFRQGLAALLETTPPAPTRVRPKTAYVSEKALPLLWQALAALAQGRVGAFATAGTLLGLEREGRLLAHDKDIDIGVPLSRLAEADRVLRTTGWRRTGMGHRFERISVGSISADKAPIRHVTGEGNGTGDER